VRQFLLQMAGLTGTGKSTLAQAIAAQTSAVVVDKDVIMAGALRAGIEPARAGAVAYEIGWELAKFHLAAGNSVILDNPAAFVAIRSSGMKLAKQTRAKYRIIECRVPDRGEQEQRLQARQQRHKLQPTALDGVDIEYRREGTAPLEEPHLTVDTTRPQFECLKLALSYLVADDARLDLRRSHARASPRGCRGRCRLHRADVCREQAQSEPRGGIADCARARDALARA
jgi:predicted kinase